MLPPFSGLTMNFRNVRIPPQHYTASPCFTLKWKQHGPPKRWSPTTTLHDVTIHHPEDGGSMNLRNVGILPQYYTASPKNCPCALTEHHAMKAYWRSGGIAPRILDFVTREGGEWSASRPGCFIPRKRVNSQPLPGL
jgi:hypothetical protein